MNSIPETGSEIPGLTWLAAERDRAQHAKVRGRCHWKLFGSEVKAPTRLGQEGLGIPRNPPFIIFIEPSIPPITKLVHLGRSIRMRELHHSQAPEVCKEKGGGCRTSRKKPEVTPRHQIFGHVRAFVSTTHNLCPPDTSST